MATFVLFGMMLFIMLMRVRLPIGVDPKGKNIKAVALSLRERTIYQRISIYSIGFVILLTAVSGVISPEWELMVVLVSLGLLLLPVRILVTTAGVGINNVVFRPWDEFTGFTIERRRIRLVPRKGLRPFFIPLLASRQEEILPSIRRYLKAIEPATPSPQRNHTGLRSTALR